MAEPDITQVGGEALKALEDQTKGVMDQLKLVAQGDATTIQIDGKSYDPALGSSALVIDAKMTEIGQFSSQIGQTAGTNKKILQNSKQGYQ